MSIFSGQQQQNLNVSNVSNYNAQNLRDKLSHKLETIVKKTQRNLNSGVVRNPNQTSINRLEAMQMAQSSQSPNYRGGLMARQGGLGEMQSTTRYGSNLGKNLRDFEPDAITNQSIHDSIPNQQSSSLLYNQNFFIPTDRPQTASQAEFRGSAVPQTSSLIHGHNQSVNILPDSHITASNAGSKSQLQKIQIQNEVESRIQDTATRRRLGESYQKPPALHDNSRDLSPDFFSGVGAGNVNAILNNPNRIDHQFQSDLMNRLNDENVQNNVNIEQRQRIFEDIIIQRIKVIQNYVKKQIQKVRVDIHDNVGENPGQPVILNSIHNDGMALDLKIKDILKWKMEAYEQKWKQKEEKMMQIEIAVNRHDKQFKDTIAAISDATQQEFDRLQNLIFTQKDRLSEHEANLSIVTDTLTKQLTKSVSANVTDIMTETIMPQIDQRIQEKIEANDKKIYEQIESNLQQINEQQQHQEKLADDLHDLENLINRKTNSIDIKIDKLNLAIQDLGQNDELNDAMHDKIGQQKKHINTMVEQLQGQINEQSKYSEQQLHQHKSEMLHHKNTMHEQFQELGSVKQVDPEQEEQRRQMTEQWQQNHDQHKDKINDVQTRLDMLEDGQVDENGVEDIVQAANRQQKLNIEALIAKSEEKLNQKMRDLEFDMSNNFVNNQNADAKGSQPVPRSLPAVDQTPRVDMDKIERMIKENTLSEDQIEDKIADCKHQLIEMIKRVEKTQRSLSHQVQNQQQQPIAQQVSSQSKPNLAQESSVESLPAYQPEVKKERAPRKKMMMEQDDDFSSFPAAEKPKANVVHSKPNLDQEEEVVQVAQKHQKPKAQAVSSVHRAPPKPEHAVSALPAPAKAEQPAAKVETVRSKQGSVFDDHVQMMDIPEIPDISNNAPKQHQTSQVKSKVEMMKSNAPDLKTSVDLMKSNQSDQDLNSHLKSHLPAQVVEKNELLKAVPKPPSDSRKARYQQSEEDDDESVVQNDAIQLDLPGSEDEEAEAKTHAAKPQTYQVNDAKVQHKEQKDTQQVSHSRAPASVPVQKRAAFGEWDESDTEEQKSQSPRKLNEGKSGLMPPDSESESDESHQPAKQDKVESFRAEPPHAAKVESFRGAPAPAAKVESVRSEVSFTGAPAKADSPKHEVEHAKPPPREPETKPAPQNALRSGMELPKQGLSSVLKEQQPQAAKAEPKAPAQAKPPASAPRKPVIDEAVWQHPTHPLHHKISDAVDNHLHNIIQELMEQHKNQPDPYAGLDKLNSELQAKKPKPAFRPIPSDLDDLEDLDPHEKPNSVRHSQNKYHDNFDLDELEDL